MFFSIYASVVSIYGRDGKGIGSYWMRFVLDFYMYMDITTS